MPDATSPRLARPRQVNTTEIPTSLSFMNRSMTSPAWYSRMAMIIGHTMVEMKYAPLATSFLR